MITLRKSNDRGHANHGWLESYHTFSFADYQDPRFLGFKDLLVINEDIVQPGTGFGKHGHKNMEIITYIISGELKHEDSMGNGSVLKPGQVQRMSAGKGILHSEVNPSTTTPVHLLQIWITPNQTGMPPSYEEKDFRANNVRNAWTLLVSPAENKTPGALHMHQNAYLYAAKLEPKKSLAHTFAPNRCGWLQVVHGPIEIATSPNNTTTLNPGDGAAIENTSQLTITAQADAEFLLFDLRA